MRFKIYGRMAFFDRSIIRNNWSRMNRGPLSKAGAYVRKVARNSIRRRSYAMTSLPGSPPYSHQPGKSPPFKQIYHVPYVLGTSEIVGMVGYGDNIPAPGIHEHGLSKAVTSITYRPGFHRSYSKKQQRWRMAKNYERVKRVVDYPARPFMFPALIISAPVLPPMWSGSLGGR